MGPGARGCYCGPMEDELDAAGTPAPNRRAWLGVILLLCLPFLMVGTWLGTTYWAAERAESEAVTGVVPVLRDGTVFVVVSGHSEKTTQRGDKRGSVSTTDYPRLTSYRAADGEQLARRQYAPVFLRFEYVDTVIRALLAVGGQVWILSTDPAVGLHAVAPATLADELDAGGLLARYPALQPGIHMEPGTTESPVAVGGRELMFRLNSGPYMALDPERPALRTLSVDGAELDELHRAGSPRGSQVLEKAVEARHDALEPAVPPVYDLAGHLDAKVGFVLSQTSLDREQAHLVVSRWTLPGETDAPVKGWETSLDAVSPECCDRVVWRFDGLALLWYGHSLVALDDATGAVRWQRRL